MVYFEQPPALHIIYKPFPLRLAQHHGQISTNSMKRYTNRGTYKKNKYAAPKTNKRSQTYIDTHPQADKYKDNNVTINDKQN